MPQYLGDVRCWVNSGNHLFSLSFSGFDPQLAHWCQPDIGPQFCYMSIQFPRAWGCILSSEHVERRLAAILAADVAGSCRLIGTDEEGTLAQLKALRKTLFDPKITDHHGRIVKNTGDGALVEFGSVVDAVRCAVEIQRAMAEQNIDVPQGKRIEFRIGIHVGDIVIEDDDIFGDGVNIAVRLEGIAEPGGVSISDDAHRQIRGKVGTKFEDLGSHSLKNIAEPMRVWRAPTGRVVPIVPNHLHTDRDLIGEKLPLRFIDRAEQTVRNLLNVFALSSQDIASGPDILPGREPERARPGRAYAIAGVAIGILIVGAIAWAQIHRPAPTSQATSNATTVPELVAPRRVSIAVLPLLSLSAPTQDDYFADGLTEDIISALGRFSQISVRSRNSVFAYKDKAPRPEEIGRDLNVRYILEGSVRRNPEQIRIAVRLSEASHGNLVWSEKYAALPKDLFSVQGEITRRIVGTLAVRVSSLEAARLATTPPHNLEAYDLVLRGRNLQVRATRTSLSQARPLFERAIDLDPKYVPAYVGLGMVELYAVTQGWTSNAADAVQRAEKLAAKAIALDETNSGAHGIMGRVLTRLENYDRALEELKRAIALNPSDADGYEGLSNLLVLMGDFDGAIRAIDVFSEFQPSLSAGTFFNLGTAQLLSGRSEDSVRTLERSVERYPSISFNNAVLAAAYAAAGRKADAERQAAIVRRQFPFFSSDNFGSQFQKPQDREKLAASLKEAGL